MTRGREENSALVVTRDHDPTTVRASLESVLSSDLADVPVIIQRCEIRNVREAILDDCVAALAALPDPAAER